MKKKMIIVLMTIAFAGVAIVGTYLHVTSQPEYALNNIIEEVQRGGFQTLESHLTPSIKNVFKATVDAIESPFAQMLGLSVASSNPHILSLLNKNNSWNWNLKSSQHDNNTADFLLSVEAEDISGEIEIVMTKYNREWLIADIYIPVASWIM